MTKYDFILNPEHYVAGRSIQPIQVIESWQLCHHLACVIKYTARLERKEDTYQDLQKAEWYLKRELDRYQRNFNKCQFHLVEPKMYHPKCIAQDWELSLDLEEMLMYMQKAKKSHSPKAELNQALQHLQSEMKNLRNRS